ncbi:amidohydrolase family protein [Pseudonocardia sp. GCM10023141]|uniref:amidohydrolase family protein n=1 Tax=Pseudonocardia sp. GCM10023141 TaxID=3252653 RepID=UPI00361EF1AC
MPNINSAPLLITAAELIRGPVADRIDGGAVLVRDGRIAAAGSAAEVTAGLPAHVATLAFPGATILPGLINGHVHLSFEPGPDPVRAVLEADDAELLLVMAQAARTLLDGGVTTARDLGDRGGLALHVRDAVAAGRLAGPRILAAGAPLTPTGGHCYFLGGEVDGPDAIRARIRASAAAGVDLIKVMASGGQITKGGAAMWESQFDVDDLRVIVDEAARHGLGVAAHAHGSDSIAAAVEAGVATVEHCTWMAGPGASDQRADVAERMAQRGIVACPASSGDWRAMGRIVGEERALQLFSRLRWMADLGVRVVPGTDAGLTPFDGLPATLGRYRDFGFTATEILDMATTGAADALGVGTFTGRLRAGFAADLIVVDGDPVADLDALSRIELVMAQGRLHRPAPIPTV